MADANTAIMVVAQPCSSFYFTEGPGEEKGVRQGRPRKNKIRISPAPRAWRGGRERTGKVSANVLLLAKKQRGRHDHFHEAKMASEEDRREQD